MNALHHVATANSDSNHDDPSAGAEPTASRPAQFSQMSQSPQILWFCQWNSCIETFDSREYRNEHVLTEHIANSEPITYSQYQQKRVFDGSLSGAESSGMSFLKHTQSQSQTQDKEDRSPRKKRKRSPSYNESPSLPSPPRTSSVAHSPAHTPTFAALSASGSTTPAMDEMPHFPTFHQLFPSLDNADAPSSQESSHSGASLDYVHQQLTQGLEDDDDYANALNFTSSAGRIRSQSPGSPHASDATPTRTSSGLRQYTQSTHPLDVKNPLSQSLQSSQDPWDDLDIPMYSQLQTQAPYQSQERSF